MASQGRIHNHTGIGAPFPCQLPRTGRGPGPRLLTNLLRTQTWREVTLGASASRVFRLTAPNTQETCYLKCSRIGTGPDLCGEKDRLVWLQGKLPVPRVLSYEEDRDWQYLLISEVEGVPACDPSFGQDPLSLVAMLAQGLRLIHSVRTESCPFDARLEAQIARAHRRMLDGLVDETNFDPARRGRTARELYKELLRTRPPEEDLVFTHGDYCLPNVIIRDGRISGFVDLGEAGIADRYRDLALAARSIRHNLGPRWVMPFFHAYGLESPDRARIEFYQLLDEFF
ncbi:MAG: APH(3') family aminoglycoside O-phosphotransferase [Bacillota bacterium]